MFQVPGLTLFQPVLGPNTFLRLSVNIPYVVWLVVSTPLKNISQLGLLFQIYGKIKAMFQTTNQLLVDLPNLADVSFEFPFVKSSTVLQMVTIKMSASKFNKLCCSLWSWAWKMGQSEIHWLID